LHQSFINGTLLNFLSYQTDSPANDCFVYRKPIGIVGIATV